MTDTSLLDQIKALSDEITAALAAGATPEVLTTMSATSILKANAITAAQTSSTHALNRKAVDTVIAQLKAHGVDHPALDTPLARTMIATAGSFLVIAALTNPALANTLPQGWAFKLSKVFTCANQGALNELFENLIPAILPMLQPYVDLADDHALADEPVNSVA